MYFKPLAISALLLPLTGLVWARREDRSSGSGWPGT